MRAALLALALTCASAQPANALLCNALLGCTCTVDATNMSFGQIQPLTGSATTANADIQVSCTGVIDVAPSVTAKLNAGQNGTIADRQMKTATNRRLHYNIYDSTLYGTIVGDGLGGYPALTISGGIITLGAWSATQRVYGRVPASPTMQPGEYSDTVTVRIDW